MKKRQRQWYEKLRKKDLISAVIRLQEELSESRIINSKVWMAVATKVVSISNPDQLNGYEDEAQRFAKSSKLIP
jgi:hypothetical protein